MSCGAASLQRQGASQLKRCPVSPACSYATTDCPGRRQLLEWLAADLRQFMPQLMPPLKRAQPPAGKNGTLGLAPHLELDAPRRQTADRDAPLPAAPAATQRHPRAGCSCLCW